MDRSLCKRKKLDPGGKAVINKYFRHFTISLLRYLATSKLNYMSKLIMITGATAGFGRAIARKFAENGHNLIITGRRQELLDELAKELRTTCNVEVLALCFDVRKQDEVEKSIVSLPENLRNIDVLVNNAGLAVGLNPVHEGVVDDWERMIDTNVKGLLYMTRMVSPRRRQLSTEPATNLQCRGPI